MRSLSVLLAAVLWLAPCLARGEVYQTPDAFLSETFAQRIPKPKIVWLTGEVKRQVRAILNHDYASLRVRYWSRAGRSAWILDEVGKDLPITTGIVIGAKGIERLQILEFRESRGWEVRYPFFTEQFAHAGLTSEQRLDTDIDGISGATLSVGAVERLARMALYLHRETAADAQP
jgi:FMN-binding domain